MPPRRITNAARMEQEIARRVAEALAATGSVGSNGNESRNTDGTSAARGCTYKEFRKCKPQTFTGTEGPIGLLHWFEKLESVFRISNCADEDRVKYTTCTLQGSALTWWNTYAITIGTDAAFATPWEEVKQMMTEEYCPRNEIRKLEDELWELKVKGTDINGYTRRFRELALLCPDMVTPESRKVERYIWGLPSQIRGNVISSRRETIESVVGLARELMDQVVRQETMIRQAKVGTYERKRRWNGNQGRNPKQHPNRKQEIARTSDEGTSEG